MLRRLQTIMQLNRLIEELPKRHRDLFHRLFQVSIAEGQLIAPAAMYPWITERFGSVEAVEQQKIVKVINKITLQGALFNEIRANRPIEIRDTLALEDHLFQAHRMDTFRDPLSGTPEDVFGRVRGKECVTASNIAKYDGFHGLVIFDEYIPFNFTHESLADYIDTSLEWAKRAHQHDPEAKYFFLMWNCLWRSGATIVHGHFQMTLSRDTHYTAVEYFRRCAQDYASRFGSNYFDDLFQVHQALGCATTRNSTRVMAPLTPVKEKGIILMGDTLDGSLKEALYQALTCYRDRMGVQSFNLAVHMPPIASTEEDWSGFPVQVHVVDRGDPLARASDIGGMELYAQPVISSDPFRVAQILRAAMGESTDGSPSG